MINLTYAECREHGRTLFGKWPGRRQITCMICDRPVSAERSDIHTKEVRQRKKKIQSDDAELGRGSRSVSPSQSQGILFMEED
jgi:hypothetical protein